MGQAVQRKTGGNQKRARAKLEARKSGVDLSQRETGAGQGINEPKPQLAVVPRPAPVIRPVTHSAAGMQVPVTNKTLKSRFGIGERPLHGALLEYSEVIQTVLCAGLDHNWVNPEAIDAMLTAHEVASPEQGKESFALANQVLKTIYDEVLQFNAPVYKKLATFNFPTEGQVVGNYVKANGGGWEIGFVAGIYEEEHVEAYNITSNGLIAGESGVCVMFTDLLENTSDNHFDELTITIAQFFQFCCALSNHASTVDMILDDMIKWQSIGELADIEEKDAKKLMAASGNYDSFHAAMKTVFGEDYEEDLYISLDIVADYYKSYEQASALNKCLKPLSEKNVKSYLKKIKKSKQTPAWLITATEILLAQCDWSIDMNKAIQSTGHIPYPFTKPCGFGFSIEHHIFESLHENFMNDEEDIVSLCIPFSADTARVLANLDLGETLILFANEMLYNPSIA